MIVDASVHVWISEHGRYPWSPIDGVDIPAADASAEKMLADLGKAGVQAAVAVQPRAYGYDHSYLARVIADHPGRIAGVCLVDSDDPQAPEKLGELASQGFAGVRLIAVEGSRNGLAGSHLAPLLRQTARLGLSVSLLVEPHLLADVRLLAADNAAVTFIVDHLGLCSAATSSRHVADLLALADLPNVNLRLSAMTALSSIGYPFEDLLPLVHASYAAFGAGRLLWGTDYPHVLDSGSYSQSLDAVQSHMPFIEAADLDAILGGNAARIFHLNPGSHA